MNGNASPSTSTSPSTWRSASAIPMTDGLQMAIAAAYELFAHYRYRFRATVCHCDVCVSDENHEKLLKTPLRQIDGALLNEYSWSAHGVDAEHEKASGPISDDLRYLLPRYFELIATNDLATHDTLEHCLSRLGQTPYRQHWPKAEVEAIDGFFDALLRACLSNTAIGPLMGGLNPPAYSCALAIEDYLIMMVIAGGDLARLLNVWDQSPGHPAALHMASMRRNVTYDGAIPHIHSPFLESKEYKKAAEAIGVFLMRPVVTGQIERAFFATHDPHEQQLLSGAL
jgi:hypothetical protein